MKTKNFKKRKSQKTRRQKRNKKGRGLSLVLHSKQHSMGSLERQEKQNRRRQRETARHRRKQRHNETLTRRTGVYEEYVNPSVFEGRYNPPPHYFDGHSVQRISTNPWSDYRVSTADFLNNNPNPSLPIHREGYSNVPLVLRTPKPTKSAVRRFPYGEGGI